MLRDLDHDQKLKWFDKWDQIFLNDNPRYQHEKFKAFVFETVENLRDERKRQLVHQDEF